MFGLMAVVIIALGGAVVDYVSLEQARGRAQIALDAAALALQPEIMTASETSIKERAKALLLNRIADERVTADIIGIKVDKVLGSLYLEARMDMPTVFVALVGVNHLGAKIASETTRGSLNVEVAVAVDVTGSMKETISASAGGSGSRTKMDALKDALNTLIDIVVQDEQKPTYSKMAVIPYSAGVNVGAYADAIRGPIKQPTNVTSIGWASSPEWTIASTTNKNPVEVTTDKVHGFAVGDYVYINNVTTMTAINNTIFRVGTVPATNRFTLQNATSGSNINGTSYKAGSKGTVTRCAVSTCELVVTSAGHGLASGDNAYLTGAGGMVNYNSGNANTWINNNPIGDTNAASSGTFLVWNVSNATPNTFVLPGTSKTLGRAYGTYTSGGTVSCVVGGCTQFYFQNKPGTYRRQPITTCVSERTVNAFTDASPQTTFIGRNYPYTGNPCLPNTIVPLTHNKGTLHALANNLSAVGSTAGHLGVGWAWYMVSPNFNGPWPADSQPAAKDTPNVLRAVVLMTDGDFNTAYCNGVVSQSSTTGSGATENQIKCDAPNGSAFSQAEKLCAEMKRAGIRVYTVGLDVANLTAAKQIMANCATDASHAYQATTSEGLAAVFADIGRKLSFLRVTK